MQEGFRVPDATWCCRWDCVPGQSWRDTVLQVLQVQSTFKSEPHWALPDTQTGSRGPMSHACVCKATHSFFRGDTGGAPQSVTRCVRRKESPGEGERGRSHRDTSDPERTMERRAHGPRSQSSKGQSHRAAPCKESRKAVSPWRAERADEAGGRVGVCRGPRPALPHGSGRGAP